MNLCVYVYRVECSCVLLLASFIVMWDMYASFILVCMYVQACKLYLSVHVCVCGGVVLPLAVVPLCSRLVRSCKFLSVFL